MFIRAEAQVAASLGKRGDGKGDAATPVAQLRTHSPTALVSQVPRCHRPEARAAEGQGQDVAWNGRWTESPTSVKRNINLRKPNPHAPKASMHSPARGATTARHQSDGTERLCSQRDKPQPLTIFTGRVHARPTQGENNSARRAAAQTSRMRPSPPHARLPTAPSSAPSSCAWLRSSLAAAGAALQRSKHGLCR